MKYTPVLTNDPLDYELTELLGEKSAEFILLHINGKRMEGMGTPYATERNLAEWEAHVTDLNTHGEFWADFFESWKVDICRCFNLPKEATHQDFKPEFSIQVSRVCAGYCEHLHCGVGLFEQCSSKLAGWSLSRTGVDNHLVNLVATDGRMISECGPSPAKIVAMAFVRLLKTESN